MAIDVTSFQLPIDVQQAKSILQYHTNNFGVFADIDRMYELQGLMSLEAADAAAEFRRRVHDNTVSLNNSTAVIQKLVAFGIPYQEFLKAGNGESIAKPVRDRLINNPNYSDEAKDLINLYGAYTTANYNISILKRWVLYPRSVALSKNKHRMALLRPTWNVLSTSRLSTDNPNVQGLSRNLSDIITEPRGYTLVRCDSGQIEPRINFSYFLRDELIMNLIQYYDDAYFGLLHYCLMTQDAVDNCRRDFETFFKPIEITEELQEKRQLIKRMVNAGSYGSSNLDSMDPSLARAFEIRIKRHPKRLELERKVIQSVEAGCETFYSAFGTPVTPESNAKYSKGSDSWEHHIIKCGINNPVQTTAADLMLLSVYTANNLLKSSKSSWIAYYKHDEAAFYVSDEDAENGLIDKLKDITAYNVKGWLPIPSDCVIGIKKSKVYPSYIM